MAELKCEFPEGCMLDLWAKVIKAKYVERQVKVLDTMFCASDEQLRQNIYCDDIKVKVIQAYEEPGMNKRIFIELKIL